MFRTHRNYDIGGGLALKLDRVYPLPLIEFELTYIRRTQLVQILDHHIALFSFNPVFL